MLSAIFIAFFNSCLSHLGERRWLSDDLFCISPLAAAGLPCQPWHVQATLVILVFSWCLLSIAFAALSEEQALTLRRVHSSVYIQRLTRHRRRETGRRRIRRACAQVCAEVVGAACRTGYA